MASDNMQLVRRFFDEMCNARRLDAADQLFAADYSNSKVTVTGLYNGMPLNYYYDAPLIWTGDGRGKFTLDPALRSAVQGPTNAAADGTACKLLR